jgi:hypothetical protein
VAEPPLWAAGWFGHPQIGRFRGDSATPRAYRGGSKAKPLNFFASHFALEGGRTTPMSHGGGSAIPRSASLGVAKPPRSQMGHPKNYLFFFFKKKKP